MEDNTSIVGLDLSLEHFGMVILNAQGQVFHCIYEYPTQKYVWEEKKLLGSSPILLNGFLTPKKQENEGRDFHTVRRIAFSSTVIQAFLLKLAQHRPWYVAIEDYALGAAFSGSTGLVQIAEMTGTIKHWIYINGGTIRTYDPSTVKLYATGKGNALKRHVIEAAVAEGFNLPLEMFKEVKKIWQGRPDKELDGPGSDLCDAYTLAKMLWTELQVRAGNIELKDLPEHIREKIFFRVTKANPINLLARDFIHKVL
jgi:hypothetical protein